MNTPARIILFGLLSGLIWSFIVNSLFQNNQLSNRSDLIGIIVAGTISGVVTSGILALSVTRFGASATILFGLLSLPLGAFIFGFNFALIDRYLPSLTSGMHRSTEPWTVGGIFALGSVSTVFAVAFFPLAVFTTLLLRAFIDKGSKNGLI